jgi:hypothetical protein
MAVRDLPISGEQADENRADLGSGFTYVWVPKPEDERDGAAAKGNLGILTTEGKRLFAAGGPVRLGCRGNAS